MADQKPVLTFRVTERYDGGEARGKIRLSTEPAERPYAVTREQAHRCANEHVAHFEEVDRG